MDNLSKLMELLQSENVFLTGGGGVGKSYLCNEVISKYKNNNRQVVVLGSTGISAVHVGGQTLHSFFVFGIANDAQEMTRNDKNARKKIKQLNEILSKCELLIIDEISMVSANLMDMIRYRLKNANFTGRILFVGDFFQLPPVNKQSNDGLFGENIYAFESLAWEYFEPKILMLTSPKRTEDLEFFDILNHIRIGEINEKVISYLENLRQQVEVWEDNPTVLFGTNNEADNMNTKRLYELENELFVFLAQEEIYEKSLHVKKLENWKKSLMVNESLELKIGANVLFCTNKKGSYFNGERGIVVSMDTDSIDVQKDDFSIVSVQRHEFTFNDILLHDGEIEEVPLASIKQFPLKLAYAITIHKSQGMSIEKLACNVDRIFEKSQFYVALSRATNPNKLFLYYSRNDFASHLRRCVKIDEKVVNFYENCDTIFLEK